MKFERNGSKVKEVGQGEKFDRGESVKGGGSRSTVREVGQKSVS